ncbi:MAG: hypothetical protein PHN18_13180 [Sulfurospirillaceae bacterium]|jgi:hypothetical protein|nr:hypothetical protein [Sulfurospirillaceae bacterium]MDD2826915.1 hypothetical protein [Sulfurospirillaceae bacterium]
MSKYTKVIVAFLLSISLAYAAENEKVNAMVMINMENGLANIQKGFLYNNIGMIKEGVETVSKENMIYHDRNVIRSILPENKKQMENLALITSKRIDNATDEMKSYIALKQMKNAHNAYMDIVNACTDCHVLVRGW